MLGIESPSFTWPAHRSIAEQERLVEERRGKRLKEMIETFWLERGKHVHVVANGDLISSNMKNGLPPPPRAARQ